MKFLLILCAATALASAAGSRNRYNNREDLDRGRRANLDYEDIETGDQDTTEEFEQLKPAARKSSRIGAYSAVQKSIQVTKNKSYNQRRIPKSKDSEASGTHFDGNVYGGHQYVQPQVQQIHTHELLANQGLVSIYHHPQAAASPSHGNILLAGGLGGAHHHPQHAPIFIAGGGGPAGIIAAGPPVPQAAIGPAPPGNDLSTDITKSVYVFSAPPDPFDISPRPTITKVPQRQQKHYQVLFINSPTAPQAQHHVELPPPPELKTLVYVLVKKPQPPPPINFIKSPGPPHLTDKPEVYFIRYKNRGHGISPSPVGPPIEEQVGLPHPHAGLGLQYAPVQVPLGSQEQLAYAQAGAVPVQSHYEAASQHHPQFALNAYHHHPQDDTQLAASHLLRGPNREVDAGVTGI